MLAFDERGKPKYLEKPLGAEKRAYNELNPDMVAALGLNPKTHWWGESDPTSAPSQLSLNPYRTCRT